jgi:hypothetical protein
MFYDVKDFLPLDLLVDKKSDQITKSGPIWFNLREYPPDIQLEFGKEIRYPSIEKRCLFQVWQVTGVRDDFELGMFYGSVH